MEENTNNQQTAEEIQSVFSQFYNESIVKNPLKIKITQHLINIREFIEKIPEQIKFIFNETYTDSLKDPINSNVFISDNSYTYILLDPFFHLTVLLFIYLTMSYFIRNNILYSFLSYLRPIFLIFLVLIFLSDFSSLIHPRNKNLLSTFIPTNHFIYRILIVLHFLSLALYLYKYALVGVRGKFSQYFFNFIIFISLIISYDTFYLKKLSSTAIPFSPVLYDKNLESINPYRLIIVIYFVIAVFIIDSILLWISGYFINYSDKVAVNARKAIEDENKKMKEDEKKKNEYIEKERKKSIDSTKANIEAAKKFIIMNL